MCDDSPMAVSNRRLAQRRDPVIGPLLSFVRDGSRPTPAQLPPGLESRRFIWEYDRLRFC